MKPVKSSPLFENPVLDYFSRCHPIIPLLIWGPVALAFIYRARSVHALSVNSIAAWGVFGFFSWTLAEYVLHRFVFHYVDESEFSKRFHRLIHGIHHEEPEDWTRLVMPPVAAAVIALALFIPLRAILGPVFVEPFFGFFLIGYLCYDYTHYAVHHFRPRTAWGRTLKQNHMVHHFVDPNAFWGVSSPLWDYVFGTASRKNHDKNSNRVVTP